MNRITDGLNTVPVLTAYIVANIV